MAVGTSIVQSVTKYAPQVVQKVSQYAPAVLQKADVFMQSAAGKTTAQVASDAKRTKNTDLGLTVVEALMRGGVTAEELVKYQPAMSLEDLKRFRSQLLNLDAQDQTALESRATNLTGEPVAVLAHDVREIEWVCRTLSVSSEDIPRLGAAFGHLTQTRVQQYKTFMLSTGRQPK